MENFIIILCLGVVFVALFVGVSCIWATICCKSSKRGTRGTGP